MSQYKSIFDEKDCESMVILRECIAGINADLDWTIFAPAEKVAIREFVYPILGKELFEYLCKIPKKEIKKRGNKDCEVLLQLRCAVGSYAMFHLMPKLNIVTGALGVRQARDEKSTAAPQWAYQQAMDRWCDDAYDALESLIYDCLHKECDEEKEVYAVPPAIWEGSKAYKNICASLISGPEMFEEFYNLSKPGRFRQWLALLPFLKESIECDFRGIVCWDYLCDLVERLKSCLVTDKKEKQLVNMLRRFNAISALYRASVIGDVLYTDTGFRYETRQFAGRQSVNDAIAKRSRETFLERMDEVRTKVCSFIESCRDELTKLGELCGSNEVEPEDVPHCSHCGQHRICNCPNKKQENTCVSETCNGVCF